MTMMHSVERWAAGIAACAALAAGACGNSNTGAAPQTSAAPALPMMAVTRVVQQPVDVTLDLPGELDPYETVAVFSRVAGFVKSIRVDRGSRVRAGDVLAELDAPELVAQRAEAQSKLQAADAQVAVARSKADADGSTYERLTAASATAGVVAGNDLAIAQKAAEADRSQVVAAQQNVEAARQALNSTTQLEDYLMVRAPFDGIVTERNVHPGALVGPNTGAATIPLARVVNISRLRLVVPVPEAYLAGITEGSVMPFTVPAYPGESFTAVVARVSHAVDVKTRTMAVELEVPNHDGRLAPGTFCQVRWTVRRPSPSLFVPSGSVTSTTGRTFIVRVRNGRTEWVDIKTGLAVGPLVEVFGDLQPGDQVAVRGTDEIRAGTEVRVKP
jgi:membrane fusion protein, multidrug efflux system